MIDPRVASGLRDVPPAVMIPRERMLASFRQTFASFGFLPIETPHIERMEVLTGKGAGSDEVLRQIFDVTNKGGTPGELALRFDLTVPLARFVAKHVNDLGTPFKRYAIGSVFRGERPAKGRFREFVQCDFDTVGTESELADAEIVQMIYTALKAAEIPNFVVSLSHRKILDGFLECLGVFNKTGQVLRSLDKLEKVGRDKVFEELQRPDPEQDGKPLLLEEQAKNVVEFAEKGKGGFDLLEQVERLTSLPGWGTHQKVAEGIGTLRWIGTLLHRVGIPMESVAINLGLARGLDYYTGVVFETTVQGWERFGSVASGGRYDNLASLFTDRKLPGVGASIGLDRLLSLMEEAGLLGGPATTVPVLVANFFGVNNNVTFELGAQLRSAGIGAEIYPDQIAIGKQMGYGSTRGHKFAVIVGPDEFERKVFNLRDLATRQETKGVPWDDLVATVRGALAKDGGVAS